MRTTDHPRARIVALTLSQVSEVLASEWRKDYGIPEALADVTAHDTFTRILCERALSEAGVDVFWNDLVCSSPVQAAAAVAAVADRGIDLEALYGENCEALLGVIQGCVLMDSSQLASLGYQLSGRSFSTDFDTVYALARMEGCEPMLDRVLSDVQVACHKAHLDSQARMDRHLKGVRAAELTAAYYVLKGVGVVMDEGLEHRLCGYPPKLYSCVGGSQYNRSTTTTTTQGDNYMTIYKNPLDIITAGYSLPDGYDSWGIKSVGFDGRTKHGFQWPEPGKATAVYPLDDHGSSCPRRKGDGLCVATTWAGMASGGYRAFCILLVAYRAAETRGNEAGKLRCPQVFVVDRLDGESLVRRNLQGADLRAANLRGANLRDAEMEKLRERGAVL
jgi:hypothetical protein